MKNKLLLVCFISLQTTASEHELQALMQRHNQQTLFLVSLMGAIGVGKLIENSSQICGPDAFCLRLTVPVAMCTVTAGAFVYQKFAKTRVTK
jgi:hypothetical protein